LTDGSFKESATMKGRTTLWTIGIASVLLLSFQVLLSTKIISYSPTDWGLISRLPPTFWIGLSLLGVLLYTGRKSERETVIAALLIFFFLFVIPTLVLENRAEWLSISYYRASQVDYVLSTGHIQFNNISPWELLNWPGFFFISASVSAITGLPTTLLAEAFPLLVLALIGIVTYTVLKLRFNNIYSCLGALWVIASFYTGQQYFSPQATAYIFYIAILLLAGRLFLTKSWSTALTVSILILFVASVTTHLLTSFLIMGGVVAVYVSRKIFLRKVNLSPFFSITICLLLLSIFFVYQTMIIKSTFIELTSSLYGQIMGQDTHITQVAGISQNRVIGSTAYTLEIFGTYSITIFSVIIAVASILIVFYGLLKHKTGAKSDVFWIGWMIIAALLGFSISYGGEGIIRAFMFILIPACYFAIKYLRKKPRILIVIIILLIFLHFPASYASENYIYVPTTEIKGALALSQYTPPTALIFYEYLAPTPFSINDTRHFINIQVLVGFYSMPSSKIIQAALGEAQFVVSSGLQNNVYQYFFGTNILAKYDLNQNQTRLYDNGEFTIFSKTAPTP
jgi:hypothetical protein